MYFLRTWHLISRSKYVTYVFEIQNSSFFFIVFNGTLEFFELVIESVATTQLNAINCRDVRYNFREKKDEMNKFIGAKKLLNFNCH